MQQLQLIDGMPETDNRRVRAIVETLANLSSPAETVAEVAHDARNMVTALGLYCDLLEEPGVLVSSFAHYGGELRLVAAASRRLVEKLVAIDLGRAGERSSGLSALLTACILPATSSQQPLLPALLPAPLSVVLPAPSNPRSISEPSRAWELAPAEPIKNLAAELMVNRNLLSSLAGPAINLTTEFDGGARPVRLTGEDLTRVLINLVKNACEAMPSGGRIHIALGEQWAKGKHSITLTVEDDGPGIPEDHLEKIFASGFSAPAQGRTALQQFDEQVKDQVNDQANGQVNDQVNDQVKDQVKDQAKASRPSTHRGLGLAITRSIIQASGGRISASNSSSGGARFTIELPVII